MGRSRATGLSGSQASTFSQDSSDFSVVGFPYPDLPDLVVYSNDKVGIPGLNEDLTFTFSIDNIGPVTSGVDFEYVVSLSLDFTIDPSDATLTDTAQVSLGSLAAGASVDHTSTVQITRANHDTVLGAGFTIDDLLNTDAFLLVWVDSDEEVLEHNEINTTFVQAARLVDVILVLDNSGSMSGTVTVSNGTETKLGVLKPSGPRRPGRHRTSGDRGPMERTQAPTRRPTRGEHTGSRSTPTPWPTSASPSSVRAFCLWPSTRTSTLWTLWSWSLTPETGRTLSP